MIKYYDKIDSLHHRYFTFDSPEVNILDANLEFLLKILYDMEAKGNYSGCYYIDILNADESDNDTFVSEIIDNNKNYNIFEIKKLLSDIAINRFIIVSSDLSEIYCEGIEVGVDEFSTVTSYFDYGIMYGNKSFAKKDIVYTNYLDYGENDIKFKIERLPNPIDSNIAGSDVSEGIYCMYNGILLDENNNELKVIDTIDIPLPSSTFYKNNI